MISESRQSLDGIIQEGARRMLQEALEIEVEDFLSRMAAVRTEEGRLAFVRNGSLPARDLVTGAGPIRIQQTRVRNQRRTVKFTSRILLSYLRRVPSIDALIPRFI